MGGVLFPSSRLIPKRKWNGEALYSDMLKLNNKYDIYYDMNVVSRYMQQNHDLNWKEAKRIPQYIQGTRTYGIHYAADSELELVGYTDSDWVGDSIDQKSTSGYVFMFCGVPICWYRKK